MAAHQSLFKQKATFHSQQLLQAGSHKPTNQKEKEKTAHSRAQKFFDNQVLQDWHREIPTLPKEARSITDGPTFGSQATGADK